MKKHVFRILLRTSVIILQFHGLIAINVTKSGRENENDVGVICPMSYDWHPSS